MPTGYNTASGSGLKEKEIQMAAHLHAYLKKMRDNGDATPDNPLCGAAICRMFDEIGRPLSEVSLRALVNHLRQNQVPIASCSGGYFYARYPAELKGTIHHLSDRIAGIQKAVDGLVGCFGGQSELL